MEFTFSLLGFTLGAMGFTFGIFGLVALSRVSELEKRLHELERGN
ncbi:MAG: hypothetical protein RKH07_03475 [Gammaproteobacteria bacterium]